jgi:hypothetical protein
MKFFMSRFILLFILFFSLTAGLKLSGSKLSDYSGSTIGDLHKDTIDKQLLYNGRVWRVLYKNVKGFEFLFTKDFLPGSVTIDGKTYNNLELKYDIYNDEILTATDRGIILQLNKEMVEKFTLYYENRIFYFHNIKRDSLSNLEGYVNVLHDGKTAFYVKYKKDILLLADDNKNDIFSETYKNYLLKDKKIYPMNSRKDLTTALIDKQPEIKAFIKKNKIQVSKKVPGSFIPVLIYYDTL